MKLAITLIYIFCLSLTAVQAQEIIWDRSYGGIHGDYLFDALPTRDFGFLLAGSSVSDNTGNKKEKARGQLDYWLWKMDENGFLDWEKALGGSGADLLSKVVPTRDGGYLLAGTSTSPKDGDKAHPGYGREDYWVVKLNADGSEQWQKTLGGLGSDRLVTALELPEGGFLLAGASSSPKSEIKEEGSYGASDYWIVKLSGKGSVEWETTLGGRFVDRPIAAAAVEGQGIYVLGYSNSGRGGRKLSEGFGEGDFWLVHLDGKGTLLWEKNYGGERDDRPTAMIALREGGLLLGGISNSPGSGNKQAGNQKGTDFWLLTLKGDGTILRESTHNIGKYDVLTSLVENRDGTLLLGGYARSEKTGKKRADKKGINDYVALKLDAKGEEVWRQEVGSKGDDMLRRLFVARDGSYILAGTTNGSISRDKNTGQGRHDFWVVKLGDKENEEDPGARPVEAFPNPTSGFTNVVVTEPFETGEAFLYDLNGRLLGQYPLTGRTLPVDLSKLPIGVYLVNVETDTVTGTVKIIKHD